MKIKHDRMVNSEKPLPLILISDQNEVINSINRQENEEREEDVQAAISADLRCKISISKAPWVRKWV